MKKKTKKLFLTTIATMMIFSVLMSPISSFASQEELIVDTNEGNDEEYIDFSEMMNTNTRMTSSEMVEHLTSNTFFIKNAYSGRYLDVSGGIAANGTNIQQYEFNGTASQQWDIGNNGDGTITIYSKLGNNYVVDISGGLNADGTNIHLYQYNGTDAQKFKLLGTSKATMLFPTKISNYTKIIEVKDNSCENQGNVEVNTRDNDWNQEWIFEPVTYDFELGAYYSIHNSQADNTNYDYSKYVAAYPRFKNDCTNFVSQCLLASGVHYQEEWSIYRKNNTYNYLDSNLKTNYSWDTTIPGPWMTANNLKTYMVNNVAVKGYKATGTQILEDPSTMWNLDFVKGTLVQIAYGTGDNAGASFHSMIITDYYSDGNNSTYLMTYHSGNKENKNLLEICAQYPNDYFLFYVL